MIFAHLVVSFRSDISSYLFQRCSLRNGPACSSCSFISFLHAFVMPTEIVYMDTEDKYKYMVSKIHIFKVHIFKLDTLHLRITKIHIFKLHILYLEITKIHIFKSIFRFPISSLGLPNFSFSEKLRRSIG
jgi:hypothetical protein